ncbi:PET112 family protein [Coniella lustricola]|uniref:Glutamyl-tRNA(Gln) amidotransferase subunit B, mitochondrial n=1 Tax=Coniella lustricola TaxID=2025994 RepID=A0A2T3A8G1_9PEZI|nr:PET112 family protein [Coniella lustricola]
MARVPLPELRRYLLRGQLSTGGCLHLLRSRAALRPSQLGLGRGFTASALNRNQQQQLVEAESNIVAAPPSAQTPIRKALKAALKAQKKAPAPARRQTIDGWELTVGIEIHAQLNSLRKLFSSASPPSPTDEPNTRAALFDLATPGSQPVFQPAALVPALRAALALNCTIQPVSRWDRKHYFWWDQPGGYQITQFHEPFASEGCIKLYAKDGIAEEDGASVTIGIQQVQMEQDTAKTIVRPDGMQWVDFNRVGVPLIEIITKPQIHYPKTAAALVRKVQAYLNSVDACVSGMEAGGLRADVNVSVRRTDQPSWQSQPLGQRTEIKNLSSFKAVEDAIIAERDRQISVLDQGGIVLGETRGWSIGSTETIRLRGKEGEVDYRYMPDPDLAPLLIEDSLVAHLKQTLGMLPDSEVDNLSSQWGLKVKDAMALMQLDDGGRLEYFYDVVQRLQSRLGDRWNSDHAALAGNWVLHELGRLTSDRNVTSDGEAQSLGMHSTGTCSRVPAEHLADILLFLCENRISANVAKDLLFAVFRGAFDGTLPEGYASIEEAIKKEELWFAHLTPEEYEQLASQVLESEEQALVSKFAPYFSGKLKKYPDGQLQRLVGRMMKTGPAERIDPRIAQSVLRKAVEEKVKSLEDQ